MPTDEQPVAGRRPSLALVCLTVFLLILPLTLTKPGIPPGLKADEAAYYLAALSLWQDGDLECTDLDVRRLFREFSGTDNLIVMGQGRGKPVYFGVPLVYPLVATPLVGLFGANGMVLLNALLLVSMVWIGVAYLRRHNSDSISLVFTVGYFALGTAFTYVFWMQAEVLNMACVMAAFYLVVRAARSWNTSPDNGRDDRSLTLHAAGAAVLLATVVYSRPMVAVLAVPLLYRLARTRSRRALLAFVVCGVATPLAIAALSYRLTEQTWPYFAPRAGISLASPVDYLERRVEPRLGQDDPGSPARQIARGSKQLSVTLVTIVRESLPEFVLGRHGGFLIYMPFAVLAVIFFFLRERRSAFRWLLLVAAGLTAVLFLTVVRGHWLGGGGFVGNRYFTAVYPSLFFLVRRIHPPWLTAVGYGAAAAFLGPLLITPLGAMVAEPTLQAHVRNQPFPRLPLEWSLARTLAGYRHLEQNGVTFHGRSDEIVSHEDELWVHGAKRVEINLLSSEQTRDFVFDVRSLAPDNRIEICLNADCRELAFESARDQEIKLRVIFDRQTGKELPQTGPEAYRYRLTVESDWGEQPRWRGSGDERFYVGAALAFLGSTGELEHDLYGVEWLKVDVPQAIEAGDTVTIPLRIRNSSPHTWPSSGAARVRIGFHWLREDGLTVSRGGRRTELPTDLRGGGEAAVDVRVDAPRESGRHVLVLDLVRERVSWFSTRDESLAYRSPVEIQPSRRLPEAPDE